MLHVYRPRWSQRSLFGVNQPSGCWGPASTKFQEPSSCPWACPLYPHGQMTMILHTYRQRQFQWTWFRVNQPVVADFRRPQNSRALIMPMGMPIMPPWANGHGVAHLQPKTVPMNLIWSESAQWLLSSSVRKIPGALITSMGMPIMPPWANDYNIG